MEGADWELFRQFAVDVEAIALLKDEEQRALARKVRDGDHDAQCLLVESNLRFVLKLARKYWRPGLSIMELVSGGYHSLMNATKSYNPDSGVKFMSYAGVAIRNGVLNASSRQYEEDALSLDDVLYENEEGETCRLDFLEADAPGPEDICRPMEIRRILEHLTPREKAVLERRYWHDETLEEVGRSIGVSKDRARQIEGKALIKLRTALTPD